MRDSCKPVLVLLTVALMVGGCKKVDRNDDTKRPDDTGDEDDDTPKSVRWTFAVFLNGDNDLEEWVMPDLNEMEKTGSGDGVHVVVQADRIEGYSDAHGDWTDARRYYITHDTEPKTVTSPVVEELGEVDMGDPEVLSEFLMWAHKNYPSEYLALIVWDHGDSWARSSDPFDDMPEAVSWDETSNSELSIAKGHLRQGLEDIVAARGPIDVVGFDACLMGSWEVAHSLQDQASYMAASEASVGMLGFQYHQVISMLRDAAAEPDGADLADELAASAAGAGEWTFSAIDLKQMGDLNAAVDELAGKALNDVALERALLKARTNARGVDSTYKNWYLDLNDLGRALTESANSEMRASGEAIEAGIDEAVLSAHNNPPYAWSGGLTIMFDETWPSYLDDYSGGAGATWSQQTQWDDWILHLADM